MELAFLILELRKKQIDGEAKRLLLAVEAGLEDCGVPAATAKRFREGSLVGLASPRAVLLHALRTAATAGEAASLDVKREARKRVAALQRFEDSVAALPGDCLAPFHLDAAREAAKQAKLTREWLEREVLSLPKRGATVAKHNLTVFAIREALAALGAKESPKSPSQVARRNLMKEIFPRIASVKEAERRGERDCKAVFVRVKKQGGNMLGCNPFAFAVEAAVAAFRCRVEADLLTLPPAKRKPPKKH